MSSFPTQTNPFSSNVSDIVHSSFKAFHFQEVWRLPKLMTVHTNPPFQLCTLPTPSHNRQAWHVCRPLYGYFTKCAPSCHFSQYWNGPYNCTANIWLIRTLPFARTSQNWTCIRQSKFVNVIRGKLKCTSVGEPVVGGGEWAAEVCCKLQNCMDSLGNTRVKAETPGSKQKPQGQSRNPWRVKGVNTEISGVTLLSWQ